MEALPGTECQVDYGTGAWIVGADGKRRKTHLFRVVLSCSRKAYSEVSFTQETECFLRALENAFRHFGGVPETTVIGDAAHAWARAMLNERGIPGTRLLSLRKKHALAAINTGCAKALEAPEFSLKGLRRHIINSSQQQESFTFIDEHPLIRATAEYEQLINSKGLFQ